MSTIKLKAPAKINWTLDVKGKRSDGYHEVEMLMQSIALWDEIILTDFPDYEDSRIFIYADSADMPLDGSNLAVRAARLIMDSFNISFRLQINIKKAIPAAAGLAGGSADAAAVLAGLNELWKLRLSLYELMNLGSKLGADVPFCITGGTAVARGIGDELQTLSPLKGIYLVLIKPDFGISTKAAYQGLDLRLIKTHPDWERIYETLQTGQFNKLPKQLGNVLESVIEARHPEIGVIKEALILEGAAASAMTGSGPAVFGIFYNPADALRVSKKFKLHYAQVYMVSTYDKGVEIIEGGS